jgi:hypothetical protein
VKQPLPCLNSILMTSHFLASFKPLCTFLPPLCLNFPNSLSVPRSYIHLSPNQSPRARFHRKGMTLDESIYAHSLSRLRSSTVVSCPLFIPLLLLAAGRRIKLIPGSDRISIPPLRASHLHWRAALFSLEDLIQSGLVFPIFAARELSCFVEGRGKLCFVI